MMKRLNVGCVALQGYYRTIFSRIYRKKAGSNALAAVRMHSGRRQRSGEKWVIFTGKMPVSW